MRRGHATTEGDIVILGAGYGGLTIAREAILRYLRALTPEQLQRTGRHPRYGAIQVREHVVEWAYHDLDHLRQILVTL